MTIPTIQTLGELKKSGYRSRSVKEEIRENLIEKLKQHKEVFTGVQGYEDTVIPQLQTAILSKHNIILLGLRGQAKTRMARLMVELLDEYMPVVSGSEINDDPLAPISVYARDLIAEKGDKTPVAWVHRNDRYTEKLATPDVSVADLIGDVDPIKAASLKLTYADERVIHYGLIPRSHRGIFVINELPDLQARIQVSLFNILQEGDLQIRGFKLRLPLDIQFVFTANPEDYTNRGSIVTPLKDRIDSQILTHYPKTLALSKKITTQEAHIPVEQNNRVEVDELLRDLIEEVAMEARRSELVDQKSGVSARMTISALENLFSHAERRLLISGGKSTKARIADLYGILPAITGKVELVYEGELEGAAGVAQTLIGKAIRTQFEALFPNPEKAKKAKKENPYARILSWFNDGNTISFLHNDTDQAYKQALKQVDGLEELVKTYTAKGATDAYVMMEFVLHGLAEFSQLSKQGLDRGLAFQDIMSGMFTMGSQESEEE